MKNARQSIDATHGGSVCARTKNSRVRRAVVTAQRPLRSCERRPVVTLATSIERMRNAWRTKRRVPVQEVRCHDARPSRTRVDPPALRRADGGGFARVSLSDGDYSKSRESLTRWRARGKPRLPRLLQEMRAKRGTRAHRVKRTLRLVPSGPARAAVAGLRRVVAPRLDCDGRCGRRSVTARRDR